MNMHPTRLSLLMIFIGIGINNQALAQHNEQQPTVLDTITVSAQQGATKLLTPVIETPQSVSIITQEQIYAQGANSVQRATSYTPGIFSNQIGASNRFDYIVMRGFSDGSLGNSYLNGLKILGDTNSHSSLVIDPWFLDSIEVIRGPSSVLYGQASPGGIVALQTREAQFDSFGELQLGFGNYKERYAAFDVNETLANDKLAARLTAKVRATDTQVDQVKEERYAIMPSLAWRITPNTRLDLMAYIQREPEGGYHSGLPYAGTVDSYYGKKISRSFFEGESDYEKYRRDQTLVAYSLEHYFNDNISFRQKGQYLKSKVELNQVYAFGWASPTDLMRYYSGSDESLRAYVIDNQLEFNFNTGNVGHRLLTGVDYQWRENDVSWPSGAFPSIDAFNPSYCSEPSAMYPALREHHKLKQTGIYVQDLMSWGRWRASLGGRFDKVDISSLNIDNNNLSEIQKNQFSSKAGLLYLFDNGFAPYASYSTSFTPTNFVDVNGDLLKPMQGSQVEIGLKYQPNGSRNFYSLALYEIKQKDVGTKEQPTDPYRAVGEIRSRGLELDANFWATDNLSIKANYSYNDIRYVKSDDGNQGNYAIYAPRNMASIWANYHYTGKLRGLNTAVGVRYVNGIQSDRENTHTLPSYALFDLSVGYDFANVGVNGMSMQFNVQNLLDKKYVAACNSLEYCYFGAGRNISLNMNYKF